MKLSGKSLRSIAAAAGVAALAGICGCGDDAAGETAAAAEAAPVPAPMPVKTSVLEESDVRFAPEIREAVTMAMPDAADFRWGEGEVRFYDADGGELGYAYFSAAPEEMSEGYKGPVPVPVAVILSGDGTVVSTAVLPCSDTPKFIKRVEKAGLLNSWDGRSAADAVSLQVTTVTGATYSSQAIINSVRTILKNRLGN